MAPDLDEWWDSLAQADRDLFMEHRNVSPLPAAVIDRYVHTGQITVGTHWVEANGPYKFAFPEHVRDFLRDRYTEKIAGS